MTSLAPSLSISFLRLPMELRRQVCFYLLPFNENHVFESDTSCTFDCTFEHLMRSLHRGNDRISKRYSMSILSVNHENHDEASTLLFRGSTMKQIIWEWGINFLESKPGDTRQAWFESFLNRFDFSQPKRLVMNLGCTT